MIDTRSTSGILAVGTIPVCLCMISSFDVFALNLKLLNAAQAAIMCFNSSRTVFRSDVGRSGTCKFCLHTWQDSSAGAGDAGLRLRCQMMNNRSQSSAPRYLRRMVCIDPASISVKDGLFLSKHHTLRNRC